MSDQSFNPYQAQLEQIQTQIADNQTLLDDPEMHDLAVEEILRLEQEQLALQQADLDFQDSQIHQEKEQNQFDAKKANAIIEIRGGAGGDEAKLWANELMRMYQRYAADKGLKVEMIDELVFKISGRLQIPVAKANDDEEQSYTITEETESVSAYNLFRYESGVHRVQRVPVTEAAGRIHTSTASVAVLPEVSINAVEIREEDLEWSFMRAGGAGGQSVNKTSSAVRLVHTPSGIVVNSRRERKQAQNRQIALELLRAQLWQIEEDKKEATIGAARSNIGRNMRSEKIKTYNFPQSRVTDHRIHHSWFNLPGILEGDLDDVLAISKAAIDSQLKEETKA
jgi:peptide chain release factor 1